MRKSLAAVLLSLLITTPLVFAQYQRVVYSGKGETRDIAISHPLSYWTSDPTARDDGGDLCLDCKTSDGKIVTKQDYHARVDVNRLGSLGGHEIVEIFYRIHGDVAEFGQDWVYRILLVDVKPDRFEEVYHLQQELIAYVNPASGVNEQQFKPSRIVAIGKESVLATYDSDGGNGGGCREGYWWFDTSGPHPVDFNPVYKAIGEKTPKDSTFTVGCWTIDLDDRQIHTDVRKINAECHACGQLGTATAEFDIVHGVAKPTKVEFDSDPQD